MCVPAGVCVLAADVDNSGKIDFWEFATLMAHKMGDTAPDKTLQTAFSVFDGDGNGTISAEELKKVRDLCHPSASTGHVRVIATWPPIRPLPASHLGGGP